MSDKLTPQEIAAFCDAVQSMADFYRNGGKEPWHNDRLSSWVLVEKLLPKLRAMAEVPEDWEEWMLRNFKITIFGDTTTGKRTLVSGVRIDDLRDRLRSLPPCVPVSELRDTLDAWLIKPENDRLVSDLWDLIAKHGGK